MVVFVRLGQMIVMALLVCISLYFGLQPEPPLLQEILDEIQKMDQLNCMDGGTAKLECDNLMGQLKR